MILLSANRVNIPRSRVEPRVPHVFFNVENIRPTQNEVCGNRVPQKIGINSFLNTSSLRKDMHQLSQVLGQVSVSLLQGSKEIALVLSRVLYQITHKRLYALTRKINHAIFASFSLFNSKGVHGKTNFRDSDIAQFFRANTRVGKKRYHRAFSTILASAYQAINFRFIKSLFNKCSRFSLPTKSHGCTNKLHIVFERLGLVHFVRVGVVGLVKLYDKTFSFFSGRTRSTNTAQNALNAFNVSENSNRLQSFEVKDVFKSFHNCVINYLIMRKGVLDYASTPSYGPVGLRT